MRFKTKDDIFSIKHFLLQVAEIAEPNYFSVDIFHFNFLYLYLERRTQSQSNQHEKRNIKFYWH